MFVPKTTLPSYGTFRKSRTKPPPEQHQGKTSFPTLDVITQPNQPKPNKAALNFTASHLEGQEALAQLLSELPMEGPHESTEGLIPESEAMPGMEGGLSPALVWSTQQIIKHTEPHNVLPDPVATVLTAALTLNGHHATCIWVFPARSTCRQARQGEDKTNWKQTRRKGGESPDNIEQN